MCRARLTPRAASASAATCAGPVGDLTGLAQADGISAHRLQAHGPVRPACIAAATDGRAGAERKQSARIERRAAETKGVRKGAAGCLLLHALVRAPSYDGAVMCAVPRRLRSLLRLSQDLLVRETRPMAVYSELMHLFEDSSFSQWRNIRLFLRRRRRCWIRNLDSPIAEKNAQLPAQVLRSAVRS